MSVSASTTPTGPQASDKKPKLLTATPGIGNGRIFGADALTLDAVAFFQTMIIQTNCSRTSATQSLARLKELGSTAFCSGALFRPGIPGKCPIWKMPKSG